MQFPGFLLFPTESKQNQTFHPNRAHRIHYIIHYFYFQNKIPQIEHSSSTKFKLRTQTLHNGPTNEEKKSIIHKNKITAKTTWQVQSTLKEETWREKSNCTVSHDMVKLGELEKESEMN